MLRSARALAGGGLVLGLGGAAAATRVLRAILYETPATDALTFASVAAVLAATTVAAAWLPARRAARLDPLAALRVE
jgi:ABC-type antimicrobial peptide transport system permease subunit